MGCMWRVHASVEKTNWFFYIMTMNNEHTCGVAVRTSKLARMTSSLVSGLILEEVSAKPLTRPVDVVKEMKDKYGSQSVIIVVGWRLIKQNVVYMWILGCHSINYGGILMRH